MQGKHFGRPSLPGRMTWPEGLPEHRGGELRLSPGSPENSLGSVFGASPSETRAGPRSGRGREAGTHFVEAVDWMPPLEVRVQYLPV